MMTRIDHLYVHVPFCKTICSYCDFCHVPYKEDLCDKWLDRLEKDFKKINDGPYKTIYIGGGTPSCLKTRQLERLLKLIRPFSTLIKEYTIEINPESIDPEKVLLFKSYGINRISMGLQSSSSRLLKLMNRAHDFEDVRNAVTLLKANGLDNISLDIIYSLPTQTMEDLISTIDDTLALEVPHISLYSLTIEKGTAFDILGYESLDEDMEADMYEYIEKRLTDAGYTHYEIANFAKKGYESIHNSAYWDYNDYRGLSCGATGKYDHKRYTYTSDLREYLDGEDCVTVEELSLREEAFENIMMSLRTLKGLDMKLFKQRYGIDFKEEYKEAIERHKDDLLFEDDRCICLKREILNTVLLDFMER